MKNTKVKQGAASFYVVAFSTLILLIVVASFTALVIAQITRSSNDDLSQSAYDSALAGVEDAKLAYYSYQNCVSQGAIAKQPSADATTLSCGEIIWLVENAPDDCDAVAKILGRTVIKDDDGNAIGVSVDETTGGGVAGGANNMQQAYTCTKLQSSLKDYRTTLSSSNPMKAVNVKIDNMGRDDITVDSIKKIKVSWGSDLNASDIQMTNFTGGQVKYRQVTPTYPAANPPTIAIAIVQAEREFTMSDLTVAKNGRTDRGMVYLTPVTTSGRSTDSVADNYIGTSYGYDASAKMNLSKISASSLIKSNDLVHENLPLGVSCPNVGVSDFACSAMIELPQPVDSNGDGIAVRDENSFTVAMLLPYGAPTDVMLEFFCADDKVCGVEKSITEEGNTETSVSQINLKGMQIGIDSTGRANDLFRRVDTRIENGGSSAISIMGPLELFGYKDEGDSEDVSLEKSYPVQSECNFSPRNCN